MKFSICVVNRKHTASFGIVSLLLAIAPLWLMLAATNTSAHAQASDGAVSPSTSASTASSPADWTQFLRDNMQRWNPYETVLNVSNVGALGLKWSYTTGGRIYSSPAVANGVTYIGSGDGNLYALNASNGALIWKYSTGGAVYSSPAVVNGVVYFGSDDGNLYALNASTGAKLWSNNTGNGVRSGATVVDGVAYFGSSALSASTGTMLWSLPIPYGSFAPPAVVNGVVYLGSDDFNVYALNANTGAKLWSYMTSFNVDSSPVVANGVVYIGSVDGAMYALDASNGAQLWHFANGAFAVQSSPAVANGVVYIGFENGSYLNHSDVYALNSSTGAPLWSFTALIPSSPALADGVVYFGSVDGNVYALNSSTGVKLWSFNTGSQIAFSSPAVVDGTVYIGSGSQIYAFALGGATADLFLRIQPTPTTVQQGDLITYAFPVWNLGPDNAVHEVLNTQVPAGTTFDYIRISGTPGLGTCTTPPYEGTGEIVCHENSSMASNTTWTVRLTVKMTAPVGTVITESAATLADTPDPNLANNTATVSIKVQ